MNFVAFHIMNEKYSWRITLLVSCFIISQVRSQCVNGNEKGCVWSLDESQPQRWVEKKDESTQWMEVTQCNPECGKAVLVSPWLPPRDQEASWMLRYKLYGFHTANLQLSMKTEDSGPTQLFFQKGDYSDDFPEYWKGTKVVIPPVDQRHRLLLEAVVPYKDAFVAVADVTTKDSNKIEKEKEKDQYSALEAGFGGDPELWRGYTVIMDPNICLYP